MDVHPVRFGIVGVGRISRKRFVPALLSTECAVLQAAASRDVRAAEALRPTRAYNSYSALLRDSDVEAVYIATHNGLHRDLVIEALQAGKHVLCEKPLGCSADECEDMLAAADATGRLLVEAFMYRYHPQIDRVRDLVQGGVIGELMAVEASFRFLLTRADDVRLQPEWGGGALLDVGCYCVNFARVFLGDMPRDVYAWAHMDDAHGVDRSVHALLEYGSGKHAAVSCSFDGGLYQRAALIGTKGAIRLDEPFVTWAGPPHLTLHVGETEQSIAFDPVDTFRLEIEDFCAAVRSGDGPMLESTEGLLNARILDRIMAAAKSPSGTPRP